MVVIKTKPAATIAVQYPAGVEVEAIQHEGKLYFPVMNVGEAEPAKEAPVAKKQEPVAETEKVEKPSSKKTSSYSEKELMDMDTKGLSKILLGMGVDPDAFEGKNTNKKLRLLILENQGVEVEDEVEDEEVKETGLSAGATQVSEILEDFDAGSINLKKATSKILALNEDASDKVIKKVSALVAEFEDDADADIDEIASKIATALGIDEEVEEEEEKPAPKKGKSKKETLVEPEDLEVGQRVSVYWEDNEDWFDGVVKSTKKGKVIIDYDDETTDEIDPENNTKIKLL